MRDYTEENGYGNAIVMSSGEQSSHKPHQDSGGPSFHTAHQAEPINVTPFDIFSVIELIV